MNYELRIMNYFISLQANKDFLMKKTLFILLVFPILAGFFASCSNGETYAEQKEKEYKAIQSFLKRDIVVRDADGNVVSMIVSDKILGIF